MTRFEPSIRPNLHTPGRTRRNRFANIRLAVATALAFCCGAACGQTQTASVITSDTTFSAVLPGGGSVTVNGGGSVTVYNDGSITIIGNDTVSINGQINANSAHISSGGIVSLNGGTSSSSLAASGATLTTNAGSTVDVRGCGSCGTIQLTGGGSALSVSNAFAGAITLQNASVALNSGDARIPSLGAFSSGAVPVATRVADLPAQASLGVLLSETGGLALYRAGSGAISPSATANSLQTVSLSGSAALSAVGTVPNGAHSRPLQYRTAPGEKIAWVAGDLGRDDHDSRDGNMLLGEVGAGYNFGPFQFNTSIGQTRSKQNTPFAGRTRLHGNYLLAEALVPLSVAKPGSGAWLILGGYGHRGDATIRRGYLNLGTADNSTGTPNTRAYGLRARLDWENALAVKAFDLSPYAELSHGVQRIDGYTESGGGFPARFDSRRETVDEMRLGMQAASLLNVGTRFLVHAEVAHSFQDRSAAATGEVVGMFAFNLPGQTNKKDWLRIGTGFETRVGGGVGSAMLNLTTRGGALSSWLALSYQVGF